MEFMLECYLLSECVFCKAVVREEQIICLSSSKKKNLNGN